MPSVNLDELETAAMMVDGDVGNVEAWVSRETGMIHVLNDDYMDEEAPVPADIGDNDERYVAVPGIRELDLGRDLVFRFTRGQLPGDVENVRDMFGSKGAYARFSRLLETRGATDAWHRFRDEETRKALRAWCEENGLQAEG
ncbi:MAG TPA: hypothetical protein VF793_00175 [Telluria sp.]